MRLVKPIQIFTTLVICSVWSAIYLSFAINFDRNELLGWKLFSLVFMIVCLLSLIVLFIVQIRNKHLIEDEFTTKITFQAGFYSFVSISMLITLAFIVLAILMLANKTASSLAEFLDFRVVLSTFAIIQIIGSLLFMILYSHFYKKGDL